MFQGCPGHLVLAEGVQILAIIAGVAVLSGSKQFLLQLLDPHARSSRTDPGQTAECQAEIVSFRYLRRSDRGAERKPRSDRNESHDKKHRGHLKRSLDPGRISNAGNKAAASLEKTFNPRQM